MKRLAFAVGLVVLGAAIVVLSGGIDLSVGSVYALAVLVSLIGLDVEGWPAWQVAMATVAVGVICGGLNGLLIGYLRLRAFLTTLVALIIFRSAYEIVFLRYGISIVGSSPNSTSRPSTSRSGSNHSAWNATAST